jgi:mannose-6-phosphate isomerase-like protein (cupin superfamily)
MVEPVVVHADRCAAERWDDAALAAVSWRTLLSADRTPTSDVTVGVAEIEPTGSSSAAPPHRHDAGEVYVVLEGEGVLWIDGMRSTVSPGSAAYIPGGAWHVVHNSGDVTLRVLYVLVADSFADVDYEFPPT